MLPIDAPSPNTSGQGASATVPAEIDRWNWGAFLLNWIWGLGNGTPIALLMFVPFVNVIMAFMLGVKGSAWAWRNTRWDSVAHFKRVQRRWAQWGVGLLLLSVAMVVAGFFAIGAAFRDSDVHQQALAKLEASPEATAMIGKPMATGVPMGGVQISGPSGHASLSFSVTGPKGEGTVFVEASKAMGQWTIERMVLEDARSGRRVDLQAPGGTML